MLDQIRISGPVAQDKDEARFLRHQKILPALAERRRIVLDFSGVVTATQSFLHACISEAIRNFGEEALQLLRFHACTDDIRQLITTVVEYSLRARTLTHEGLSGTLRKRDVPQADNLRLVREVLDALASGDATPEDIASRTGFSTRHVHYRLHAARILEFVRFGRNLASLTPVGRQLVATVPGSATENQLLVEAVERSTILSALCPDLLEARTPSRRALANQIRQKTGLSKATAMRRAQALLSWRRVLLGYQPPLPGFETVVSTIERSDRMRMAAPNKKLQPTAGVYPRRG